MSEIIYTRKVFDKLKTELLDKFILYNEAQGKDLAKELCAAEIGYIVQVISFTETSLLSSKNDYPEPAFSNLKIPEGYILKIISDFYLELFPHTSLMATLSLHINFLEEAWEVTPSTGHPHAYGYSDDVTLEELKNIVDLNISSVRRYITTEA